jgi:hypothetical protein
MNVKLIGILVALCACLSAQSAFADVVIGTGPATTSICCFGTPYTTTYGEVFTAPVSTTLSSFTLDLNLDHGAVGNLIGGVGVWNGSGVSSILGVMPTASALTNTFWPNLPVVAGTEYVAFVSVDFIPGASGYTSMPAIFSGSGHPTSLDGFVFNNYLAAGDTYANSVWDGASLYNQEYDAFFSATFTVAAVPLKPSVWANLIFGFLGLAWMAYRRKNQRALITA